jgi:hypothetical protein
MDDARSSNVHAVNRNEEARLCEMVVAVELRTILLLGLVSACAPYPQGPEPKDPKDVQLVKTEPPSTCKEVGPVLAEAPNGPSAESKAKTDLREKAAMMGANYACFLA